MVRSPQLISNPVYSWPVYIDLFSSQYYPLAEIALFPPWCLLPRRIYPHSQPLLIQHFFFFLLPVILQSIESPDFSAHLWSSCHCKLTFIFLPPWVERSMETSKDYVVPGKRDFGVGPKRNLIFFLGLCPSCCVPGRSNSISANISYKILHKKSSKISSIVRQQQQFEK